MTDDNVVQMPQPEITPELLRFNVYREFGGVPDVVLAENIDQAVDKTFMRRHMSYECISDHITIVFDTMGAPMVIGVVAEEGWTPAEEDFRALPKPTRATVKISDLAAWVLAQDEGTKNEWGFWDEKDDDETELERAEGWLEHFALSCTTRFIDFMATQGLRWLVGTVEYDVAKFPAIKAMTTAVCEEYEDLNKWGREDSVWTMFGMGGDDDVDYNGSYIDTLTDILWAYHHRKA